MVTIMRLIFFYFTENLKSNENFKRNNRLDDKI